MLDEPIVCRWAPTFNLFTSDISHISVLAARAISSVKRSQKGLALGGWVGYYSARNARLGCGTMFLEKSKLQKGYAQCIELPWLL
jgi:hypothetical protein